MKTATFAIIILGAMLLSGCKTSGRNIKKGNLLPKEIAAANAKQVYGDHKPYIYHWTETVIIDKVEYTKLGQALVVPGESYKNKQE
jgi:hypothetical protein